MPDYNLHGLNPRDFQHLVQAIARKHIASGVNAFGDGKDGARDFTFSGPMLYPTKGAGWDGYMVGGCKFRQKPTDEPAKEADWAEKHLEKDLKKFCSITRKLKKPDYYLFVTNAALSAAADTGGRDRITKLLSTYASAIPLKGFSIWDYNDIRGFLDGDAEIRSCYGHFITSGDVLSSMMAVLRPETPSFIDIMHSFLQKELLADMSAKLQSAGEDPDVQIPLSNVFLDLPFAQTPDEAVLADESKRQQLPKVVETLLHAGSYILKQKADPEPSRIDPTEIREGQSRFVIIGGPGQGKSTFGQYLCQIYRAAILTARPADRVDPRAAVVLHQLAKQRKAQGGLPLTRRFPIRVELRTFSHALASEPTLSLLKYLACDISKLGSATISTNDLLSWLSIYPWLLILDGLDEVPPSSNRTEVLKEIENFRIDAVGRGSDILIIATTRPQSYGKEFPSDLFQHLYLTPLTANQALEYGTKLAEARCGNDERRRDELIRSLDKASRSPSTSRLMQSPLQVTIMATLLEDTGEPPQQRYRLFAEYYRTIYRRETRRKLLGGILSERQKDIDIIHSQTGLFLQVAGEQSQTNQPTPKQTEGIDSALSDPQFRELVRRRLIQIEIPDGKIIEILARITDSSLQRLVFLVRPQEGWVRFDLTSFKEFMAAEAIMTGSDEDVRKRMENIAPATYWRNVFQFAVGKCFVEREHLLDNLVSLCVGLNESPSFEKLTGDPIASKAASHVFWGSQLALDVLSDGTAKQYPGYEIRFARIALRLVELGSRQLAAKLASIYHDDLRDIYESTISSRLKSPLPWQQIGAWHLLTSLSGGKIPWVTEQLEKNWPTDTDAQYNIIHSLPTTVRQNWGARRLLDMILKSSPEMALSFTHEEGWSKLKTPEAIYLASIGKIFGNSKLRLEVINNSSWSKSIHIFHLRKPFDCTDILSVLDSCTLVHPNWQIILAGIRFSNDPRASTLAKELRTLSKYDVTTPISRWTWILPWQLGLCAFHAKSSGDLARFADCIDQGLMGTELDWNAAERRWSQNGIHDEDFRFSNQSGVPLTADYAQIGFPFEVSSTGGGPDVFKTDDYLIIADPSNSLSTSAKSLLSAVAVFNLEYGSHFPLPSAAILKQIYDLLYTSDRTAHRCHWTEQLFSSYSSKPLPQEWVELLNFLGLRNNNFSVRSQHDDIATQLSIQFSLDPKKWIGLIPILIALGISGAKLRINLDAFSVVKNTSNSVKRDVLALEVVAGDASPESRKIAIQELCEEGDMASGVSQMLTLATGTSIRTAAECALLVLSNLDERTQAESDAATIARDTLVGLLTNRPSDLGHPTTWKKLNLPERV